MKVLISWIANTHDFVKIDGEGSRINTKGTHCNLYEHLFDYDRHVLLSTSNRIKHDLKSKMLSNHLRKVFNKTVLLEYVGIEDILSIEEIITKLSPLIVDYKNDDLEVFISPGTPSMQTAWYILAGTYSHIKLFQTRPPQYRTPKYSNPIKEFVDVKLSNIPSGLVILEQSHRNNERELPDNKKPFSTPEIDKVNALADLVANTYDVTTLILGETGTGKELIARRIHNNSSRKNQPFIAINCAALSDELLESRLFGHEEGAFTHAIKDSEGAFEEANGGTIFLDEIGDISFRLQQTLLRVLQEREIAPIGTFNTKKIDVRVIVGTHRNLWQKTERNEFRADLYYRLAIAEIHTIAVRELSIKDRKKLFNYFIEKRSVDINAHKIKINKEVEDCLLAHPFPGNIREVENLIKKFYALNESTIELKDVPRRILHPGGASFSLNLEDAKRYHIKKVLEMFSGKRNKTAKALGITENTLKKKLDEIEKLELTF